MGELESSTVVTKHLETFALLRRESHGTSSLMSFHLFMQNSVNGIIEEMMSPRCDFVV
jgi:hypothetical protein